MERRQVRVLLAIAALALVASAPAAARIQPSQFADFAFRQHPGAELPLDATLRDESGKAVRLGQYFGGQPVVVILEYLRCPNLCGLVLGSTVAQMKAQKLQPGRDLQFVAISIDPRETPSDGAAARASYMNRFGSTSAAGWHFLTGGESQVRSVANAIGFPYEYDSSIDQYAHPAGFVVATPRGRISQYFLGFEQKAGQLRSSVEAAGAGVTKPAAYPLLCLCLGYDPQPGTVQAAVLGIVRWSSIAIALASVFVIFLLARGRRPA
jgi:protein SCO1/2